MPPNVFVTWQGTPWVTTTDSIGKHWGLLRERALRELRVSIPVTFMSLRQTASSICFNTADTDKELAVKMLLGLAHNSAWKYYVDVALDFLHKAVEAIAAKYFDRRSSRQNRLP